MKKIIVFNVREEEVDLTKEWAKDHNVEVKLVKEQLSLENVVLAKGFDGISTSQNSPVPNDIYPIIKEYGIHQIAQRSAGVDYYDLEEAKEQGVIISNVPSYSPESIAEFALMSALTLVRKSRLIEEKVQGHDFRWQPSIRAGVINEMTVGVIGTGSIGLTSAKLFKGLGAKIVAFDVFESEAAKEIVTYKNSIEEVVEMSDIVTLHIPATKDNFHQFNLEMFKKFKPSAYFINAARGSVVDTEELIEALDTGLLAGAALDTYENEANFIPKNFEGKELNDSLLERVLSHEKIIFTPHIAHYTDVSVRRIMQISLNSILDILTTGDTELRVN